MCKRSMNASIRAAALSSSESTNSRAGALPLGNSTYSIVKPSLTHSLPGFVSIIAILRYFDNNHSAARHGIETQGLAFAFPHISTAVPNQSTSGQVLAIPQLPPLAFESAHRVRMSTKCYHKSIDN